MRFAFIQEFDINVPDQVLDLDIRSQKVEFVLFEKLDKFYYRDGLFALLALVERCWLTGGVHAVSVLEEQVSE